MSFKDMPLDTTLQKGDIVTITGPGEHDVLVREVTGVRINGEPEIAGHMYPDTALSLFMDDDRTLTRVQRPVPALPTVEGDYILTLNNGHRMIYALRGGKWQDAVSTQDDRQYLTACMEGGATLTRVIPADDARHPKVDVKKARAEFVEKHTDSCEIDFEAVLRRVLAGEFDL